MFGLNDTEMATDLNSRPDNCFLQHGDMMPVKLMTLKTCIQKMKPFCIWFKKKKKWNEHKHHPSDVCFIHKYGVGIGNDVKQSSTIKYLHQVHCKR